MGLRLKVKPGVFIPRPETEVLVETVIDYVVHRPSSIVPLNILDIGTGSGCIAIALAKHLKSSHITAIDISKDAITTAKRNAVLNKVKSKIDFVCQDFSNFDPRSSIFGFFDLIISNPPYVSVADRHKLPEDLRHELDQALFASDHGYYFYSQVEQKVRQYLKPAGIVVLEIGDEQAEGVKKIFSDRSFWSDVKFIKDNNDINRVAIIEKRLLCP